MHLKKVFSVTSPGAFPREGLANSEGIIVSDETTDYNEKSHWVVVWTDGEKGGTIEDIEKSSFLNPLRDQGIGVYLEEGVLESLA